MHRDHCGSAAAWLTGCGMTLGSLTHACCDDLYVFGLESPVLACATPSGSQGAKGESLVNHQPAAGQRDVAPVFALQKVGEVHQGRLKQPADILQLTLQACQLAHVQQQHRCTGSGSDQIAPYMLRCNKRVVSYPCTWKVMRSVKLEHTDSAQLLYCTSLAASYPPCQHPPLQRHPAQARSRRPAQPCLLLLTCTCTCSSARRSCPGGPSPPGLRRCPPQQ